MLEVGGSAGGKEHGNYNLNLIIERVSICSSQAENGTCIRHSCSLKSDRGGSDHVQACSGLLKEVGGQNCQDFEKVLTMAVIDMHTYIPDETSDCPHCE